MKKLIITGCYFLLGLLLMANVVSAQEDEKGCKDHPPRLKKDGRRIGE